MKKVILSIVLCMVAYAGFSQDLAKLDMSDLKNTTYVETNNLQDISDLLSTSQIGFAYLNQNNTKTFNSENGIKVMQVTSENLQRLNSTFDFANSVELIIIDINDPRFRVETIDCLKLNQFTNLKYIYFRYQIRIQNKERLNGLNCIPKKVKQFYCIQLPS